MQERRMVVLFTSFLACFLAFAGARSAALTPSFTITALNTTMPTTGNGTIQFTLTSVNSYSGFITVNCIPPISARGNLPYCVGPVNTAAYQLTANASESGTFLLSSVPISSGCGYYCRYRQPRRKPFGRAIAAALLIGFSFRRRLSRGVTLGLLAVAAFVGTAGITACGGYSNTLTPGTYAFTLTASDIYTSQSASTTVEVTVPPGISTY